MCLILVIILLSFALLYFLMPRLYKNEKKKALRNDADLLVEEISGRPLDVAMQKMAALFRNKGYSMTLRNAEGQIVFSEDLQAAFPNALSEVVTVVGEEEHSWENVSDIDVVVDVELFLEERTFTDASGNTYTVVLTTSLQPVDEAKDVIIKVIPIALVCAVVLAALSSYIYAKKITDPIRKISETVMEMKSLDRNVSCKAETGDEIEELSEDINELYGRLLSAIEHLKKEYDGKAEQDKEKIDFMLAVSHELKTPLTSVRGELECMLHNIGIYADRETYLQESINKVDEMTELINKTLDASKIGLRAHEEEKKVIDLQKLSEKLASDYELIAMSKGVSFKVEDLGGASVLASPDLFEKALSNIISNAVKYSDPDQTVRIFLDENRYAVENACDPIPKEEIPGLFQPFVRKSGSAEKGHGLGLYIVDRILKTSDLEYEFQCISHGMKFRIEIDSEK